MGEEKRFENRIKKFLDELGCWYVKYWAGAAYTKTGIPDLLICCGGYFVAVEVKSARGKSSETQLWNIEKIKGAGGRALVLYPNEFENFKILIRGLKERSETYAV